MKLFSKKRLQVLETADSTIIRWWKLGFWDIILMCLMFFHITWGIASILGYEIVLGIRVVPLDQRQSFIYWGIAALAFTHLIFNRPVKLVISSKEVYYKVGFIPGVRFRKKIIEITEVRVVRKEEHFAESPPNGQDLDTYQLHIHWTNKRRNKIRGLSEEDAFFLRNVFVKQMESTV